MFEPVEILVPTTSNASHTAGQAFLPSRGGTGLLLGSEHLRAGPAHMRVRGAWYRVRLGASAGGGAFLYQFA